MATRLPLSSPLVSVVSEASGNGRAAGERCGWSVQQPGGGSERGLRVERRRAERHRDTGRATMGGGGRAEWTAGEHGGGRADELLLPEAKLTQQIEPVESKEGGGGSKQGIDRTGMNPRAVVGAGERGGHARGHPPRPCAGAAERPHVLLFLPRLHRRFGSLFRLPCSSD
uniref:Uncharacterized protein n=1 Tax=Oryza glumipatula TaxID=40148 RepID=A0A0D9ZI28_9ORYZ